MKRNSSRRTAAKQLGQRLARRKRNTQPQNQYQALEPRQLLAANLMITEFMASNNNTLDDANGISSDWIEIHNSGNEAANLLGYSLTDSAANPDKFVLPTRTLAAGDYLVVFASSDGSPDPAGNIHTNFKLSGGGEYLGFYDPNGLLLNEFGSATTDFPEQARDISFGLNIVNGVYQPDTTRYYVSPTPGAQNTPQTADLAPLITELNKPTSAAVDGENIVVTAKPLVTSGSLTSVTLRARVNYGSEISIAMLDNGSGADEVANDGVYSASISSSLYDAGDMVRWRVLATSSTGQTGKGPRFLSPTKSPEYVGTVVADSSINTPLPVIQWFTGNEFLATGSGNRGSVFYNGEFYDNIFIRRRGQSSNNSPKKNLKFDFNPGDRFLLEPGMKRVDEINLSNTYYDQADVRATLASEVFQATGLPSPITFPIQTRLNGEFYSLAIYIEQVDADFLDRNGLDPNGALYKVDGGTSGNNGFNPAFGLSGFLKRTRLNEGNSELQDLANAMNENLPQEQRAQYLYDHVDIFSMINYIAGSTLIHNADHLGKNHYIYQDTDGTGKWSFLPWDLDLTFGKNGANTPDTEVYQADISDQNSGSYPNSHPFFGSSEYPRFSASDLYNRLIDAVLDTPELRRMYVRRLRTVMDDVLQSPDTPFNERKLESRLVELLPLIQADWTADDARWIEAPQTDRNRGTDWGENLPLSTHFQRLVDRYLEPRREHLFNFHNIDNAAGIPDRTELVGTNDQLRYVVPSGDIAGWQSTGFNDGAWGQGSQGIGYDRNSGGGSYDGRIGTDVESEVYNQGFHVFTRTEFTINSAADLAAIDSLILQADYDDGFIAYINGVEVARTANPGASGVLATTGSHEAIGLQEFALNANAVSALNVGTNVLAIHGLNIRIDSSDLLLRFTLEAGEPASAGGTPNSARIPHQQIGNPTITFDDNDFDASPISGNQGQEYLRLNNPNETAVDISGWRLTGGIDLTFRPGTVIDASGSLFAVADIKAFLARTTGPRANQNRLTHGNYAGQLGITGETVQLIAADGQVMDTFSIPASTGNDLQSFLRVTEINYHPNSELGAEEFIEFTNIGSGGGATTLNLTNVTIADGPGTPFTFPSGTTLGPGQRLLVVKDLGAFQTAYPSVPLTRIAGQFGGSLSNGGERIRVEDDGGNTLFDITYGDNNPWAIAAEGSGATLQLEDEAGTPFAELGKYYSWTHSIANGGTPGVGPAFTSGVVINEVVAHTDSPLVDSIEVFNSNGFSVDIGGWYLSDSGTNANKYQIPANTTIPGNGYLVFDESDFNPNPLAPGANDFALSAALGDQVYLTQFVAGTVFRFEDAVEFGASFAGDSLGRQTNGSDQLTRLETRSLGAPNAVPASSPLVISEVNYHPAEPSPAALAEFAGVSVSDLEFVEIHNPRANSINLSNWRLRGDVDFDFGSQSLASGATLVVVSFDPAAPLNADLKLAFETEYGVNGIAMVGPFTGSLSNSFGRVTLQQPDSPPIDMPTVTPRVAVDEVVYDDLAPWANADGNGQTLNRTAADAFGNSSSSWQAAVGTPGSANVAFALPSVVETVRDDGSDVRPDQLTKLEVVFSQDVSVTVDALSLFNESTGGTPVDLTGVTFSYLPASLIATWDFSNVDLDPAFYEYQLSSNAILSTSGNVPLDGDSNGLPGGDFASQVYVALPGDATLDGVVDVFGDGFAFLASIGLTSGVTWSQGDFSGDGQADIFNDGFPLLQNLGIDVRPPANTIAQAASSDALALDLTTITSAPTADPRGDAMTATILPTTRNTLQSLTNTVGIHEKDSKRIAGRQVVLSLSGASISPRTSTPTKNDGSDFTDHEREVNSGDGVESDLDLAFESFDVAF